MMRRSRAFTLTEILVTLVIIGVLSMMALPNMNLKITDAKKKDALNNLRAIAAAQQSYYENTDPNQYYVSASCTSLADAQAELTNLNTALNLSLSPSTNSGYCCAANNACRAYLDSMVCTLSGGCV